MIGTKAFPGTKLRQVTTTVVLIGLCLMQTVSVGLAVQTNKRIRKQGLIAALKQRALSTTELIEHVQERGVDFQMNAQDEADLKAAGAAPELLAVVRANYRPGDASVLDSAEPAAPATPAPATRPAKAAPAGKLVLKEGTEVKLKFLDDLTSKTAQEDDLVNFTLDEDVKVGEVVVAKAGTKAVGRVSHAKKAGMLGRGGELSVRLEYLKLDDTRVRLRANKGKEGEGKEGTAVVLTVLFGPLGLIKKGKNVEVKAGSPLTAFVDEDITLPAAK